MIKIKLEKLKNGNIIFRMDINDELKENIIIRRCLIECKIKKSVKQYPYVVPMKYLLPIINNFSTNQIKIDKRSLFQFLEFSDEYDENYYYTYKANAPYMKKWREVGCPKIYKITINGECLEVNKEVAFERLL